MNNTCRILQKQCLIPINVHLSPLVTKIRRVCMDSNITVSSVRSLNPCQHKTTRANSSRVIQLSCPIWIYNDHLCTQQCPPLETVRSKSVASDREQKNMIKAQKNNFTSIENLTSRFCQFPCTKFDSRRQSRSIPCHAVFHLLQNFIFASVRRNFVYLKI